MKYIVDVKGELPTHGILSNAELLTLTKALEEAKQLICDQYCKYPHAIKDEEKLFEICDHCPL